MFHDAVGNGSSAVFHPPDRLSPEVEAWTPEARKRRIPAPPEGGTGTRCLRQNQILNAPFTREERPLAGPSKTAWPSSSNVSTTNLSIGIVSYASMARARAKSCKPEAYEALISISRGMMTRPSTSARLSLRLIPTFVPPGAVGPPVLPAGRSRPLALLGRMPLWNRPVFGVRKDGLFHLFD